MQKHSKQFDLILKYLVAAVMLVVALYPKFPFIRVPGTFVSIRLEDFLILFLGVFWLLAVAKDWRSLLEQRLVKAILLFLAVGVVSYFSAFLLTKTVSAHIGFFHLIRRFEYLIPFFAGMYVIGRDRSNLKFYLNILVIIVVVAFLYGVGQMYFRFPIIITQNREYAKGIALSWTPGAHINSTFAGHYDLASFLVLVLPILGVGYAVLKGVKTKVILGVTFLMGMWLLAVAVSRISIVSYFASVGIALFLARKYKEIAIMVLLSLVVFSLSSNLLTRYSRIFNVLRMGAVQTVDSITLSTPFEVYAQDTPSVDQDEAMLPPEPVIEDRSTSIRLNVEWPRAIRAFRKNVVLGTGYSSIGLASDNDYLRLLGEVGLLGFMAFWLVIFSIFEIFLKSLPLKRNYQGVELAFAAGAAGAIVGVLINAVFIDVFEASKFAILFWMIMGMVVALLTNEKAHK